MKFSIAIPSYKTQYLEEAIQSVLSQTYSDWELVIVDDCSPYDLKSVVAPFLRDSRISYYRNEKNIGALDLVDNWNRCLDYCSGDFIICMGDDDKLQPNCLSVLHDLINEHPNLGVYHCRTSIIDPEGKEVRILSVRPEFESSLEMLYGRLCGRHQYIGDFCFSTSLLKKNGGFFKLPLAWGSDDISVYIAAKGDGEAFRDGIANTNIPVFCYRENPNTISSSPEYKVKMRALLSLVSWFKDELTSCTPISLADKNTLEKLLPQVNLFFESSALYYIREDVRFKKRNLFYWLSNYRETGLPFYKVTLNCMKGLVR